MQNDTRVCLRFFRQLHLSSSFIKMIRLGKYDVSASNPHPLLVKLADRSSKT